MILVNVMFETCLNSTIAAGHEEGSTGDPAGIRRSKKCRHGGDVLRLADAAQRSLRLDLFAEVALSDAGGMDALGLNHAGIDGIDANLPRAKFPARGFGTGFTAAFGGA